jgi:hypothetical protein
MNDLLDEIKTLLETSLAGRITTFYQGTVKVFPQSYLPALAVMPMRTEVIAKTTACDQYRYTVKIRIVMDVKKYFDESGTGDTIKSQQAMIALLEGRTGTVPDADTLMGTLRKVGNIRGVNYLYNNDIDIDYDADGGIVAREGFFYVMCDVTVSFTTDLILRQN